MSTITKEQLIYYKDKLEELSNNYGLACQTRDKRSLSKRKYDAQMAIYNFAQTLPSELLGMFDMEIAPGALSVQFAGEDVDECIKLLEREIKAMDSDIE